MFSLTLPDWIVYSSKTLETYIKCSNKWSGRCLYATVSSGRSTTQPPCWSLRSRSTFFCESPITLLPPPLAYSAHKSKYLIHPRLEWRQFKKTCKFYPSRIPSNNDAAERTLIRCECIEDVVDFIPIKLVAWKEILTLNPHVNCLSTLLYTFLS
jgi:hypothetical protein